MNRCGPIHFIRRRRDSTPSLHNLRYPPPSAQYRDRRPSAGWEYTTIGSCSLAGIQRLPLPEDFAQLALSDSLVGSLKGPLVQAIRKAARACTLATMTYASESWWNPPHPNRKRNVAGLAKMEGAWHKAIRGGAACLQDDEQHPESPPLQPVPSHTLQPGS